MDKCHIHTHFLCDLTRSIFLRGRRLCGRLLREWQKRKRGGAKSRKQKKKQINHQCFFWFQAASNIFQNFPQKKHSPNINSIPGRVDNPPRNNCNISRVATNILFIYQLIYHVLYKQRQLFSLQSVKKNIAKWLPTGFPCGCFKTACFFDQSKKLNKANKDL